MMARALIIGPKEIAAIRQCVERARARPMRLQDVMGLARKMPAQVQSGVHITLADRPPDFDRPEIEHVRIPQGYRAAFTFEEQPAGMVRHLSVSVDKRGRVPNVPAMMMIGEAFGFASDRPCQFWTEEFEPGHFAVNMMQLVMPDARITETRQ